MVAVALGEIRGGTQRNLVGLVDGSTMARTAPGNIRRTRPAIGVSQQCVREDKGERILRALAAEYALHSHSASWLNMVELFFRDLTQNRLRRGIDRRHESPKPFIWTARAAGILGKVKRARRTLNKRQSV
jgi:hypothetical protein